MAKEKKDKRPSFVSPQGVAVYPWLNKPDTKFKGIGQYKTGLRLTEEIANLPLGYEKGSDGEPDKKKPKPSLMDLINEGIAEAEEIAKAEIEEGIQKLKQKFAKNPKAGEKAIKDLEASFKEADKPFKDDPENPGYLVFNFKMNASYTKNDEVVPMYPTLVDAKNKDLSRKKNIGGGSKIRVGFEIFPFFTAAVGYGVSLRMKGVKVLELVEFSGNSAEAIGFEEEEGYEADGSDADDDSDDNGGDDSVGDSADQAAPSGASGGGEAF